MRRPLLALALLAGAVTASTQAGSTAGNTTPGPSTVVYRGTSVTGATLLSVDYTVTADKITGVTPRLQGINLLTKSVTARFGSGSPVPCTAGVLTVLNVLTGLGRADYTCTGLLERSDRPRELRIRVS